MSNVETKEEFSNIISPPDFVKAKSHTILIIDPAMTEIEDLAFYLKTAKRTYNVYVYVSSINDTDWLQKAISKSKHIIVNTINNELSPLKDNLITHKKTGQHTSYYGEKNFLMNHNRIEKPIDYFVNLEK